MQKSCNPIVQHDGGNSVDFISQRSFGPPRRCGWWRGVTEWDMKVCNLTWLSENPINIYQECCLVWGKGSNVISIINPWAQVFRHKFHFYHPNHPTSIVSWQISQGEFQAPLAVGNLLSTRPDSRSPSQEMQLCLTWKKISTRSEGANE